MKLDSDQMEVLLWVSGLAIVFFILAVAVMHCTDERQETFRQCIATTQKPLDCGAGLK